MSLRAIKKRDNPLSATTSTTTIPTANPSHLTLPNAAAAASASAITQQQTNKQNLFRKSTAAAASQQRQRINTNSHQAVRKPANAPHALPRTLGNNLQRQQEQLDRATQSNPELRRHPAADTVERLANACLIRTKSESDVSGLLNKCDTEQKGLIGAKSEICLQTISSHSYHPLLQQPQMDSTTRNTHNPTPYSGAGTGTGSGSGMMVSGTSAVSMEAADRRRSECSLSSGATSYSQRTSAMSASALTLSSQHSPASDPNVVTRVPIIGYEVMEERARFTVYKLRVENPHTNDCWLVMRRYTDFVRLNTKLKHAFPHITLMLPRKKIFGDNFNAVFLDNRVQGLQMFVNSVMANEELRKCKLVREFFCLDEPPTYSESMEECRAIFEAQEETIAHLKLQISNKNDFILSLQQKLREEISIKDELKEALKNLASGNPRCTRCGSPATLNTNSN